MPGKYKIVMVRHGESEWNQKNLFCGWFDADLSDKGTYLQFSQKKTFRLIIDLSMFGDNLKFSGRDEALAAGKAIKEAGLTFDVAHTSLLTRAQNTLASILKESGQTGLTTFKTWRLNERHYGGLTGMNKAETAAKYGEDQVQIWRRSFDTPPPPMEPGHQYYDTILKDPRYAGDPKPEEFPMFESLKLTINRTLPYWNNTIIPQLKEGKKIIIAAHGNSLRGIVKHLDSTF